jgi:hypothetical protein
MSADQQPYVRPQPISKDKLREILAQAVRNTQPKLNPVPAPPPKPKRGRPRVAAKPPAKGRKRRA